MTIEPEVLEEFADKIREMDEEEARLTDDLQEELTAPTEGSKVATSFDTYVMSQHEEISKLSETHGINATEARKQLVNFPNEYIVQDQTVPDLIKKMRKARRKLKGEQRIKMSKAIDTMIDAYSDHLQKCIDSITWLNPYRVPLNKMRFNEKDLHKLNKMTDVETRREVVDALCKYWEAELEQNGMAYGKEYSNLFKTMRTSKKEFRTVISKISISL